MEATSSNGDSNVSQFVEMNGLRVQLPIINTIDTKSTVGQTECSLEANPTLSQSALADPTTICLPQISERNPVLDMSMQMSYDHYQQLPSMMPFGAGKEH